MAWARYGGERGAGPLAAGMRASGPTTGARRRVPRDALWSAATSDPPGRHAPARQARRAGASRACTARRPTTSCSAPTPSPSRRRPTTALVSGLCGRIWTLARDYPALDGRRGVRGTGTSPARSASRSPTGSEPLGDGRSQLHSEARVQPVDTHRAPAPEGDLGACSARSSASSAPSPSNWRCSGPGRRPRMPPRWSRTRCARDWMTRIGSRRRAACSPKREGRRSTASPR